MQIVFSHYHLNSGGVTQVILNQLLALATLPASERPQRVGVLYGGRCDGWPPSLEHFAIPFEVRLLPLPAIDYDEHAVVKPGQLAGDVSDLLAKNDFAPDDTLLHLHNHALGKNAAWTGAVGDLAQSGYRMLLQVHDFVEDFRPANYRALSRSLETSGPCALAAKIYPQAEGIHYATLTRRDGALLRQAGLRDDRLHLLPNPVGEFHGLKPSEEVNRPVREQLGIPSDARLVLYPVRGIRRKNLGELLLYSAVSPPDTWHAVTLAPQNPAEKPSYERWRELAEQLELRCLFDCCGGEGKPEFLETMAASNALITTSVAEGFGMVFLEAWMAGKPLVGRDLPEITCEFREAGLQLDGLTERLEVPIDWLTDRSALAAGLRLAYEWACDNYGVEPAPVSDTDAITKELLRGDTIDFALLPSRFQETVIRHAAADLTTARDELEACNPGLQSAIASDQPIAANAEIVRSAYSLETFGRRLHDVYVTLAGCTTDDELEPLPRGESILQHFLRLERLHPVRFEE